MTTRDLLAEVRRQRPGLTVLESYLDHTEPSLTRVLGTRSEQVVVVPLLLGAAYHSAVDVPAAIAATGGTARQADVLGPDPLLLRGLERRLGEAGVEAGDPSTALVLAAAGSTDVSSVEGVRKLASVWRAGGWWAVDAAFASAATPTVTDAVAAFRAAGAPRVAVATYLLFPGAFAEQLTDAGADATSAPLGNAPEVARLVLARYDTTAAAVIA